MAQSEVKFDTVAFKGLAMQDTFWVSTYERLASKASIPAEEKEKLKSLIDNLEKRSELLDNILSNDLDWGIPQKLKLAKSGTSKKRVVYMYEPAVRMTLGVLYRALSEYFRPLFADNCFSYKKGVSTSNALRYIRDIKGTDRYYGVKVDIHAYFNSVSRERVAEMLTELFGTSGLHDSLYELMFNDTVLDGFVFKTEFKSLIPGCALGSFFANYCLRELDIYFKEHGIIYARYSDDIIVLTKSEAELQESLEEIKGYLSKFGLVINESKYEYFQPDDDVEYLGLKLRSDGKIDISDHAKQKIKKTIHRWCRKGRRKIEMYETDFETEAKYILRRLNVRNFKCYFSHKESFGWCLYAFRFITTSDSLRELDYYLKDTLRAMKTGKHNKANGRVLPDSELKSLGYVSLVELYSVFCMDYDYFFEVIELL